MQLIAKGPDIPDALLQAHEDGRVVFFCGAGISYPAGLPGFKGLVDDIYRIVGTTPDDMEQEAYARNQFDATLDLLERRLPGQRLAVRKALAEALQPKLRRRGAKDTHAALLQLARNREGVLRLVTTNFDRIFARLTARTQPTVLAYPAPLLPIPKNSRWNGLVYLHGLLPEHHEASALNRLVLTSGDFGLAYLTERWAARFVSELFRNYVVCFVGYSINDPVLRYMMDALAADRMLGETTPQAYSLGDCTPGQESNKKIEWEAKGVTPILYDVPVNTNNHSALHLTLKAWAETYRDGILGKERIVVDYARARPSASTRQDDFVGRMLWALSHESGLPAKRFADFDPVPPLDWLETFAENRYGHSDLSRFGVPARSEVDGKLGFSIARRPAPYTHAPWMILVSGGAVASQWDDVMLQLARWLVRHLDSPALILWLAQQGSRLHDRLVWLIEDKLNTFSRLEREGNEQELARIRSQTPSAIPRPLMRILWRLLLTGRVKSAGRQLNLYQWKNHFKRDGLTATLRFELREILAPKVSLKKPFREQQEGEAHAETHERLKQLVDWELVLAAHDVRSSLRGLVNEEHWVRAQPRLFNDFQQLLCDALDLFRELGASDDHNDRSYWDLPSIRPHGQNRAFRDWVVLIELLRDAWCAVREIDRVHAIRIAQGWFAVNYPTFKRLALFAASHDSCVEPDQWVDWLVTDDAWWLWSINTKRETLRLLVLQGRHLTEEARVKLEASILVGPPRTMYRDDLELDHWQGVVDHAVWLHLAKLESSGGILGSAAAERLAVLTALHPDWQLSPDERDEFSRWLISTADPGYAAIRQVNIAPRKRRELVTWLKMPPPTQPLFYEDNWQETCRKHLLNSGYALWDLAREEWPTGRWREALQVWSEKRRVLRSWRLFAPLVQTMPAEVLKDVADSMTWWLEVVSTSLDCHEGIFLDLCRRILSLSYEDGIENDNPVDLAINHPIGHITQALLNLWLRRKPNDNDGLPIELEPFFTQLCDPGVAKFRHGRVLLASHLIPLFRVDRSWTEAHLQPRFDWTIDIDEAHAAWEGFLWSPRLFPPLLIAFKSQFLDTARHCENLGAHADQFAVFLTYVALNRVDTYTTEEFRAALSSLPQEGLDESAQALVQALEGAGEQREDYWTNRILPFWRDIWPQSHQRASKSIAESLARLCIAARGKFLEAVNVVNDWLRPIDDQSLVIQLLWESDLCERFPEDSLRLLNAVIHDQPWAPPELNQCLIAVARAAPALVQDPRYVRLTEYYRRRGT